MNDPRESPLTLRTIFFRLRPRYDDVEICLILNLNFKRRWPMSRVKLSKDGSSIDFVQSDNLPSSLKKFRKSPEIEGFYRFVFENGLQREAYEILSQIIVRRRSQKQSKKSKK